MTKINKLEPGHIVKLNFEHPTSQQGSFLKNYFNFKNRVDYLFFITQKEQSGIVDLRNNNNKIEASGYNISYTLSPLFLDFRNHCQHTIFVRKRGNDICFGSKKIQEIDLINVSSKPVTLPVEPYMAVAIKCAKQQRSSFKYIEVSKYF